MTQLKHNVLSATPTPVPNLPSKTGNPSGGQRGNAPARK